MRRNAGRNRRIRRRNFSDDTEGAVIRRRKHTDRMVTAQPGLVQLLRHRVLSFRLLRMLLSVWRVLLRLRLLLLWNFSLVLSLL